MLNFRAIFTAVRILADDDNMLEGKCGDATQAIEFWFKLQTMIGQR